VESGTRDDSKGLALEVPEVDSPGGCRKKLSLGHGGAAPLHIGWKYLAGLLVRPRFSSPPILAANDSVAPEKDAMAISAPTLLC
jgi:hypothetical protein